MSKQLVKCRDVETSMIVEIEDIDVHIGFAPPLEQNQNKQKIFKNLA